MKSLGAGGREDATAVLVSNFKQITALLYDTSFPVERMEREVAPHIAENVTFKDPWQFGKGKPAYRLGIAGFHAMFRFDFESRQVSVQLNADGNGGRALVDGVMHLKQFEILFVYPLRTLLVFDFNLPTPNDPANFLITAHEEMWSVGDMIEAAPLVGGFYARIFRPTFAWGFLLASRFATRKAASIATPSL
jgi:hypothetical protein